MEFLEPGKKITEGDIRELEAKLNLAFPEDYKAFLLENNGGTPQQVWLFDFLDASKDAGNTSVIRGFYKLYPHGANAYDDIERICNTMRREGTIGADMLPIADDPGGNPICMCVSEKNCGRIYFCDHEWEDAETGHLLMSEIAPSFSDFLKQLYWDD